MQWNKLPILLAFVSLSASADIIVVEDVSVDDRVQYAKVLSKSLTTEKRNRVIEKFVCETAKETIHDLGNTVVKIYRNKPKCFNKLVDEEYTVIINYHITYDFKGKIMSAKLNYDPGEYVQVHTGR